MSVARRTLAMEYRTLQNEMIEGFTVGLMHDDNLFNWKVGIFGPPDTLYAGGYFRALMKFPCDYPQSPPTFWFLTKIWHPNIFASGRLCISILHPQSDVTDNGELPCERWNPNQSVRTILLSIISLLNEPNISSPANVEAAAMYRRYRESTTGEVTEYEHIIRKQVIISSEVAARMNITVPRTREEYVKNVIKVEEVRANQSDDLAFEDIDFEVGGPGESDESAAQPLDLPASNDANTRNT